MEKSLAEKAREHGLKVSTVHMRVKRGWTEDEALSIPLDSEIHKYQRDKRLKLAGKRRGRKLKFRSDTLWTLIEHNTQTDRALCQCICGKEKWVDVASLGRSDSAGSRSCGCSGLPYYKQHYRERRIYSLILQRCCNKKSPDYPSYGGRGVICKWKSFLEFFRSMGASPFTGSTIERIDNDGPYSESNCRWATRTEQARNRRDTVWVMLNGKKLCLSEAARRLMVPRDDLRSALDRGETPPGIHYA